MIGDGDQWCGCDRVSLQHAKRVCDESLYDAQKRGSEVRACGAGDGGHNIMSMIWVALNLGNNRDSTH